MKKVLLSAALFASHAFAACQSGFISIVDPFLNPDGSQWSGAITYTLAYNTTAAGATIVSARQNINVFNGLSLCLAPGIYSPVTLQQSGQRYPVTTQWTVPVLGSPLTYAQITGAVSISGYSSGLTLPATCTVGQAFLLTSYIPNVENTCVATNVWLPPLSSATFGGIPLLSPSFGAPIIATLVAGENDIYTAPSCTVGVIGCQRHIIQVTVSGVAGTGNITYYMQIKRSGVYYYAGAGQAGAATNVTTTVGSIVFAANSLILDPGDTLALFTSAVSGTGTFNAVASRLAVDSNTPLKQVSSLAPQSGTTLVYTPPAGKNGIIMANQGVPTRSNSTVTLSLDTSTPASSPFSFYIAPTSLTPTLTTATQVGYFLATGGLQSVVTAAQTISIIPAGYSLYLQQTYNSTNEMLWFWVFEF